MASSVLAASVTTLALPASFVGVIPCADCMGIAQTLTLHGDGRYYLRRTYLGRPGMPVSEAGRWASDSEGRLILRSGSEVTQYVIENANALQQLDRAGQPIRSSLNYRLRRTAQVDTGDE